MIPLTFFIQSQLTPIRHSEPPRPKLSIGQTVYLCNNSKVIFEYEDNWTDGNTGVVKRVNVSGRDRPDVADYLTHLIHGRWIETIGIVHCPVGPKHIILGKVVLSESQSIRDDLPQMQMFEFDEDGIIKR